MAAARSRLPAALVGLALHLAAAGAVAGAAMEPAAAAGPPPPGASSCSGCHAPAGGPVTALPGLAGLDAAAIEAAMLAYRQGERAPSVMDRIARGFSAEEIRAIAAWLGGAA